MEEFWLVWNNNGFPPSYRHSSLMLAKQEAERLSGENPGRMFCVLHCVGQYITEPIVKPVFHSTVEIPF